MKFSVILSFVLIYTAAASVVQRSGKHLSQAEAEAKLEAAGIHASSTGGCTERTNPRCTSYEGILSGTVNGAIKLKQECGCVITITGGTEVGHQAGRRSHANEYKVDLRHNKALDNFIQTKFKRINNRGDGSPQWESPGGNIYADETGRNHWDVTYK
ncbi:hypothetical protein B0J17DRAFT_342152 [Rhizoctonia solani]|nr:hypothetical protein B0J17DRAFT_342152 [Rhizoctonia solani]